MYITALLKSSRNVSTNEKAYFLPTREAPNTSSNISNESSTEFSVFEFEDPFFLGFDLLMPSLAFAAFTFCFSTGKADNRDLATTYTFPDTLLRTWYFFSITLDYQL